MVLIIGSHANRKSETFKSIGEALENEKKIGGNVMQIFLGSNIKTTLSEKIRLDNKEIKLIKSIKRKNKTKLVVHGILTLNLCSPISSRYKWNVDNLVYDLELNEKLGGLGVVIHMGTYKTFKFDLTYEEGQKNYIKNLKEAVKRTKNLKSKIILETSCNQKNKIGGTIEKFAKLYKKIPKSIKDRIGVCVDTAHIFSAGYEIHTVEGMKDYWDKFDKLIGIKNCTLIHLNDSRAELCSCIDRHETLGVGEIYSEDKGSLKYLIKLAKKHSIPMVLETKEKYFKDEIKLVKSLANLDKNKKKKKGGAKIQKKKDIKEKVIDIFEKMYDFLQASTNNKSSFKAIAYRRAINSLKNFEGKVYNGTDVMDLNGFGKSMIEKVNEISETGKLNALEELESDPKTKIKKELQSIMGVGPKIANKWVNKLNILSINDLKKAIENKKIKATPLLLQGIKHMKNLQTRIPRIELEKYKKKIDMSFKNKKLGVRTKLLGSYRLGKKNSGDIDLIVYKKEIKDKEKLINECLDAINDMIIFEISKGKSKVMLLVKLFDKVRHLDMIFVEEKELPWWELYFGSDVNFSRKIREYASKKGYRLNEYGLFDKKNGKRVDFNPKKEKEIFEYLGLKYIKPKDRATIDKLEN